MMTKRMLCRSAFSFAMAALTGTLIAADTPPPLKIQTHTLKNGLQVVLAEDHSRPVINLQIWYRVGSKDEKEGRTGFAHLFEHLMFRGSKNVGPEEHMRYVREAGGVVNAYTGFDRTVYWETFPSNYLERMLWLEADRMASLDISEVNFQKEREVVKEERRLNYENRPYGLILEHVLKNTYEVFPYKHQPIGSMEDLNKATVQDVRDFHAIYYVPNNATLVAVGDFDTKDAIAYIEKHFNTVPQGKPVPRVTAKEPEHNTPSEHRVKDPSAPLAAVVSSYILPPMLSDDSYALDIASAILSSGQSSRLYKKLVYEDQSAVAAQGQAIFMEGPSLFFSYGIATPGKDIKEVNSSLAEAIDQMAKTPVTAAELEKAKNQVVAGFILGREGVQAKADYLGRCASLMNDPERYNTEIDRYRKVTAADVQNVVAKYLAPKHKVTLWIDPGAAQQEGMEE